MSEPILTPEQRIKVFISSTIEELRHERAALRKVIRDDLRLHPIVFESGASPHPPRDKYRAWLEQSNIYVGIFWESYGWVAPDMDISGIEDEYLIAKGMCIPKLLYLKKPVKGRDAKLEDLIKRIQADQDISYKCFETVEELVNLVKDDIAVILTERFLIAVNCLDPKEQMNYLEDLIEEITEGVFVERPALLNNLLHTLKSQSKVALVGEPGCGKTFLLGWIGMNCDAIYVSLRDKTPLNIYTCLANRLRISLDMLPLRFGSKEEAFREFEIRLQKSEKHILIDDANQNPVLASLLVGLEYYGNEFVIAARSESVLGDYPVAVMRIEQFVEKEIESYLEKSNVQPKPGELIGIKHACHGNPLYLYYFVNFQLHPLPDGLKAYQEALWRGLDPDQRELLGLISISLFPPTVDLLRDSLRKLRGEKLSSMEIAESLARMSAIVRITDGRCEVFHPYFRESINMELERLGLSKSYHACCGEANLDNNHLVEATYHFVHAEDTRADNYLLEAAQYTHFWGFWDISEEFLRRLMKISITGGDYRTEGSARYYLAFILHEKGRFGESNEQQEKSVKAFQKAGDEAWAKSAKIQLYLNYIAQGTNVPESIQTIEEELELYKDVNPWGKALLLVNLSYAYQKISEFEKDAETAKKAYDIFVEEED